MISNLIQKHKREKKEGFSFKRNKRWRVYWRTEFINKNVNVPTADSLPQVKVF